MSRFRLFHMTAVYEEDNKREKACVIDIKKLVCEKCGISGFIDYDDHTVAFAGSKEDMQLMLEIYTQKSGNKKYMYACVDDEVSWQECNFDNLADFEEHIAEYIADRVNKTIKTVIESDKDIFRRTSYYLNENGEWICFEKETSDSKLVSSFFCKTTKTTETIKTYQLET